MKNPFIIFRVLTIVCLGCEERNSYSGTGGVSPQKRLYAGVWNTNAANEDGASRFAQQRV